MDKSIKDGILDSAREMFAQYGFRKTTLDDIASAAGKGKSSLYYYFKNKEEIFEELINREITSVKNDFISALEAEDTPKEKLRKYILLRMELFQTLVSYFPAIRLEFGEYISYIQKIRTRYDEEEKQIIQTILKLGLDTGQFSLSDIELTAQTIIIAMKGFEFPWAIDIERRKMENDIDAMLEILFYGIMKR